jgi:IS30 family transposase
MEYIKLSYHHLNFEDRTALMLESRKEGFSARKFAELIKRHPSTIYRELKRNSINDVYQARYASDNTFARRRRGHRKLKIDSILWKFIVEAIRCLWSPQQIAKRLKTFPDLDQTMNVSHTTIYSTIRALPKGELKKDLLSCLRHENKKRKANGEPKKNSILQDIKTIHERPAEVQERKIESLLFDRKRLSSSDIIIKELYNGEKIIDVKVSYPNNWLQDQLERSKKYSFLPNKN